MKQDEIDLEVDRSMTSRRKFLLLAAGVVALAMTNVRSVLAQDDDPPHEQLEATRDELVKLRSLLRAGDDEAATEEALASVQTSLTRLRAALKSSS